MSIYIERQREKEWECVCVCVFVCVCEREKEREREREREREGECVRDGCNRNENYRQPTTDQKNSNYREYVRTVHINIMYRHLLHTARTTSTDSTYGSYLSSLPVFVLYAPRHVRRRLVVVRIVNPVRR